jgi:hypothetical protein
LVHAVGDFRVEIGAALGEEVLPGDLPGVGSGAIEHDHAAERAEFVLFSGDLGVLRGVFGGEQDGAGILDDEGDLAGRSGEIDADGHGADEHRREVENDPFRAIIGKDGDAIARGDAQREQAAGGALDLVGELRPGDGLPGGLPAGEIGGGVGGAGGGGQEPLRG